MKTVIGNDKKMLSKSSHAKSMCHLTFRELFHVKRAQQSSYPFGQLRDSLASILESRILFSNSAVWESRPFADKDSRFSCVHSEADFQLFRAWEEGREGKCECRPPRHKTSCSHRIEKNCMQRAWEADADGDPRPSQGLIRPHEFKTQIICR